MVTHEISDFQDECDYLENKCRRLSSSFTSNSSSTKTESHPLVVLNGSVSTDDQPVNV